MLSSLQNPRQAAVHLLNFGLVLSTAFMVGLSWIARPPPSQSNAPPPSPSGLPYAQSPSC